ncbi:hypothetical protein WJX81_008554 [Elliptochloris bilobata]|uniref:Uncharacterized protein n=1 Tax=Elliptochloris bilobata TaxID=381761 RepID=A0AAW1QYI0_9CHLO
MESFIEKMAEKAMGQGQHNQGGPQGGYSGPQEGFMGQQQGHGQPQMGYGGPPQGGFMGQQQGYGQPQMGYGCPPQGGFMGQQQGYGQPQMGGGEHEGLDWSHLGRLAQHYDQQPVPGDGGPPPPSDANPNIINKLLGHFQQNTGTSFSGGQDQFDQMAAMASKFTGIPIPASVLRKLIGAKLNGML